MQRVTLAPTRSGTIGIHVSPRPRQHRAAGPPARIKTSAAAPAAGLRQRPVNVQVRQLPAAAFSYKPPRHAARLGADKQLSDRALPQIVDHGTKRLAAAAATATAHRTAAGGFLQSALLAEAPCSSSSSSSSSNRRTRRTRCGTKKSDGQDAAVARDGLANLNMSQLKARAAALGMSKARRAPPIQLNKGHATCLLLTHPAARHTHQRTHAAGQLQHSWQMNF